MEPVTYVSPNQRRSGGRRPFESHTSYPLPESPFELVDLLEEPVDYGKDIDKTIRSTLDQIQHLIDLMKEAKGKLEVRIDTGSGRYYGDMSTADILALLIASICVPNSSISFRTRREGLESILNLIMYIFRKLPEEDRPEFFERMDMWQTPVTYPYSQEGAVEFRTTALALRLMDETRWSLVRDSEDKGFDDYGNVHVPVKDDDEVTEILTGTGNMCIGCRRQKDDVSKYAQLNKYTFICDECVSRISELFAEGSDVVDAHHKYKSSWTINRETMESLDEMYRP